MKTVNSWRLRASVCQLLCDPTCRQCLSDTDALPCLAWTEETGPGQSRLRTLVPSKCTWGFLGWSTFAADVCLLVIYMGSIYLGLLGLRHPHVGQSGCRSIFLQYTGWFK